VSVKGRLEDLAVLGGPPLFDDALHVGRPNLGSREALFERLTGILDRNWLTNDGPCVGEFEQRLGEALGVRNVVATCNGTVALSLLLSAHDFEGEVILPSLTFVATAHAVRSLGLTPVFADVDPRTCTLDPRSVEESISPRTAAILGVHLWGRPCDVDGLAEVAARHGKPLLFDAAQALECSSGGRPVGSFGRGEAFSFHATKVCNSFEGGAVTTNDDELAERMRLLRSFGFSDLDRVELLGTNAKMPEFAAAMGVTSLDSLDRFISRNRSNYDCYRRELEGVPGVRLLAYPDGEASNYHYIVGFVDEQVCGIARDELVETLNAENVLARRYFYPGCHRMEPYRSEASGMQASLPVTEELLSGVTCLPTGMAIDETKVAAICQALRLALENGEELSERMGSARVAQAG
jgi:dTDP-4-amino-4,6-dideoxygalactose transaminase